MSACRVDKRWGVTRAPPDFACTQSRVMCVTSCTRFAPCSLPLLPAATGLAQVLCVPLSIPMIMGCAKPRTGLRSCRHSLRELDRSPAGGVATAQSRGGHSEARLGRTHTRHVGCEGYIYGRGLAVAIGGLLLDRVAL